MSSRQAHPLNRRKNIIIAITIVRTISIRIFISSLIISLIIIPSSSSSPRNGSNHCSQPNHRETVCYEGNYAHHWQDHTMARDKKIDASASIDFASRLAIINRCTRIYELGFRLSLWLSGTCPSFAMFWGHPFCFGHLAFFDWVFFCPILISLRDSASATVVVAAHFCPLSDWAFFLLNYDFGSRFGQCYRGSRSTLLALF